MTRGQPSKEEETPEERAARLSAVYRQARLRAETLSPEVAAVLFQTGEERRNALDQMMWQVPALSVTGQSFLLTIALSPESARLGRTLAAVLGMVLALATMQLLLRHRFNEEQQSRWLEQLAAIQAWPQQHKPDEAEALAWRGSHRWRPPKPADASPFHRVRWAFARWRSPYIWISTLALFALVNAAVVVLANLDPTLFT